MHHTTRGNSVCAHVCGMSVTWASLGSTLATNVAIGLVLFTVFNLLRLWRPTRHFYAAKRFLALPLRFRPPRLPANPFTWWWPVIRLQDEKFAAIAGTDALVCILFLRLGTVLSSWIGSFGT